MEKFCFLKLCFFLYFINRSSSKCTNPRSFGSIATTCHNVTEGFILEFNEEQKLSKKLTIRTSSNIKTIPRNSSLGELKLLEILTITNVGLQEISSGAFNNFQEVEAIDLSSNNLKSESASVFNGLKKLVIINLSDNLITKISVDTFDDLPSLESLQLENNLINHIDDGAFSKLHKLQHITVEGNNLPILQENLFRNCTDLEYVHLSSNPLQDLQSVGFKSLRKLYGRDLHLKKINGNFSETTMEQAFFSGGRLEEFDFANFAAITESLYLDNNRIKVVKNFNLAKTRYILMNHNNISEVAKISPNIQILHLGWNQIKSVEAVTDSQNYKLMFLTLSYNEIETASCFGYSNVLVLRLDHNKIAVVKENSFRTCSNLGDLYLSSNLIESIEPNAFAGASGLESLFLSYNKLKEIDSTAFSGLDSLKRDLKTLSLDNNQIESLEIENIVKEIPKLRHLKINGNLFECDAVYTIFANLRKYHVIAEDASSLHSLKCKMSL